MIALALASTGALFLAMVGLLEVGRRIGARRLAIEPEHAQDGLVTVDGAIFGLMGLLIAFTFAGAAVRFDDRRTLINQETNDIGTAWLRVDLLPADARPDLRQDMRAYLDARLAASTGAFADPAVVRARDDAKRVQGRLWDHAVAACARVPSPAVTSLVIASLNAAFDTATTREAARIRHPPLVIFVLLVALALICALLVGYGMGPARNRRRLHPLAFAAITTAVIHVIIDLEYPRAGFIQVAAADRALLDLRRSMDR
jgi:hypothetical protein